MVDGTALRAVERVPNGQPYHLQLTTNWRGDPPTVSLAVSSTDDGALFDLGSPESPVRIRRVDARFIKGPITDLVRRHLRSLGYLMGPDDLDDPR
jgi:hypothetical protein